MEQLVELYLEHCANVDDWNILYAKFQEAFKLPDISKAKVYERIKFLKKRPEYAHRFLQVTNHRAGIIDDVIGEVIVQGASNIKHAYDNTKK
jgi:predicted RNA methylase